MGQDKNTGPDSKGGSRCTNAKNKNYCESQKGDCQFIPACDGNAECKFKKSLSKYINFWKCECKKPYKGNGIQCMDEEGTLSVPPNQGVDVTLRVTKEEYTYPYDNESSAWEQTWRLSTRL